MRARSTVRVASDRARGCGTASRVAARRATRRRVERGIVRAENDDADIGPADIAPVDAARRAREGERRERTRRAESTDAVATFLTRRFGLAGGLAWTGALAFGVASEQMKTRRETREAVENTRDVRAEERKTVRLPSGVSYVEVTIGGGELARSQFLVAARVTARGTRSSAVAYDTAVVGREVVWSFGGKLGPPLCRGLEEGVRGMRQGGRRVVVVPAALAFGSDGVSFPRGGAIEPDEDVEFDITLTRVSVPPS